MALHPARDEGLDDLMSGEKLLGVTFQLEGAHRASCIRGGLHPRVYNAHAGKSSLGTASVPVAGAERGGSPCPQPTRPSSAASSKRCATDARTSWPPSCSPTT